MSVYFIATSSIVDPDGLAEYESSAGATLAGHDVSLLAFSRDAKVIEGTPPGTRVVMMKFADEAAFRSWYDSDEYQKVLPKRLDSTAGSALLVEGLG